MWRKTPCLERPGKFQSHSTIVCAPHTAHTRAHPHRSSLIDNQIQDILHTGAHLSRCKCVTSLQGAVPGLCIWSFSLRRSPKRSMIREIKMWENLSLLERAQEVGRSFPHSTSLPSCPLPWRPEVGQSQASLFTDPHQADSNLRW